MEKKNHRFKLSKFFIRNMGATPYLLTIDFSVLAASDEKGPPMNFIIYVRYMVLCNFPTAVIVVHILI